MIATKSRFQTWLRESGTGRASKRLLSGLGEGLMGAAVIIFLVTSLLLFGLVLLLWFLVTDEANLLRFSLVAEALSAFAIIALTVLLLRIESRRERAEFFIDEVNVHGPPAEHDPDQFTIGFRIINTGGRESVIWNRKSMVRATDKFGSLFDLDTAFWPFTVYWASQHPGQPEPGPPEYLVAPGTVRDYVAQVRLPKAIDAVGTKLELSIRPAIGPRVKRQFEAKDLQKWLEVVRQRYPMPPA